MNIENNGPSDATLVELGQKVWALYGGGSEKVGVCTFPATYQTRRGLLGEPGCDCTPDRVEVYVEGSARLAEATGRNMAVARERACIELLKRLREAGESTGFTADEIEAAAKSSDVEAV